MLSLGGAKQYSIRNNWVTEPCPKDLQVDWNNATFMREFLAAFKEEFRGNAFLVVEEMKASFDPSRGTIRAWLSVLVTRRVRGMFLRENGWRSSQWAKKKMDEAENTTTSPRWFTKEINVMSAGPAAFSATKNNNATGTSTLPPALFMGSYSDPLPDDAEEQMPYWIVEIATLLQDGLSLRQIAEKHFRTSETRLWLRLKAYRPTLMKALYGPKEENHVDPLRRVRKYGFGEHEAKMVRARTTSVQEGLRIIANIYGNTSGGGDTGGSRLSRSGGGEKNSPVLRVWSPSYKERRYRNDPSTPGTSRKRKERDPS